ncbi:conserved Plasmodium membrane protein, unknown function [Babesia microti strain RI]|uniref:Uncharacterized protein n=1 Tax=Babesia microti (strain RI) TaxID=1133968 RepID=A0A1R4AAG3_BABMR|nr:conserved Plasmodium membrane protein, unknown function [Babesia microti strain RI]SJK85996.1 conserved Plasmodium membrane protein, unknown function [Babesia microti strain RI]|eukprot:XP_021338195.1 conserved Plasmodium membrane protein, unknown function [Babesia microti strain RI]
MPALPGSPDANSVYTIQQWLFRRRTHTRRFTKRFIVLCGDTIYAYRKVASLNSDKSLNTILNDASSRWKISGATVMAESFSGSSFYRWRVSFPMQQYHRITTDDTSPISSGRVDYDDLWFGTPDLHVAEDWILAMTKVAEYGSLENWVFRSPIKQRFTQFTLPWYLKPFEYLPMEHNNPREVDMDQNYKNFQPFRSPFSSLYIRIDRLECVPAFADTAIYCVIEVQSSLYIMRLYEQELGSTLEISTVDDDSLDTTDDRSSVLMSGGLISRWLARTAKQSDKKKNNIVLRNFIYPGGASICIPLFQPLTMHFIHIHFYSVQDEYLGTVGIPETDISAVKPGRTSGYGLRSMDTIHPLSPKRFYMMEDKIMPKPGTPSTESFYRIPTMFYSDMGIPKTNVERLSGLDNFGMEQLKGIKTLLTQNISGFELENGMNSSPLGVVYVSACNPRRLDHVYMPAKQVIGSKKYYDAMVDRANGPLSLHMLINNLRRGSKIVKLFINFKSQVKDVFHFRDFYKSIFWIFYTIISLWIFPDYLITLTLLPILLCMIIFHPSFYSILDKSVLRFPILVIFLPKFLSSHIRIPKSICISCSKERSIRPGNMEIINLTSVCNHYYSLYTCLAGYVFSNYGGWDIFERLESSKTSPSNNNNNTMQSSPLYNSLLFYIPPLPFGQLPLYTNLYYTINFFIAMLIITFNGGLVYPERLKLLLLMRFSIAKKPGIIGMDYLNPSSMGYDYYIQHERKNMFGFFSSSNLLSFEPTHWPPSSSPLLSNPPDLSKWKLIINSNTDANGWQYSTHWGGFWFKENNVLTFIRKRTWIRDSKFPFETDSFQSISESGDVGIMEPATDAMPLAEQNEAMENTVAVSENENHTPNYFPSLPGTLNTIERAMNWAKSGWSLNSSNNTSSSVVSEVRPKLFKFRPEGGLRNLIKRKFSQDALANLAIKRGGIRRKPVELSNTIEECNATDAWITSRDSMLTSNRNNGCRNGSVLNDLEVDEFDRTIRKGKHIKSTQAYIKVLRVRDLRKGKTGKGKMRHYNNLSNKKFTLNRRHVNSELSAILNKIQNVRFRNIHLALNFTHKRRFKKHFRRKLLIPEGNFISDIVHIIKALTSLSKPKAFESLLKIKPLYLKYKRPRILKLSLSRVEFRHYLSVRQQRNELLRRSGATIKSLYHHLTDYYSSVISPSPIAIQLTRALVTQNRNRLRRRRKTGGRKKIVLDNYEDKVEDDDIDEIKVFRWNLNYKGGKRFGFILVETDSGNFFRVTKAKPDKLLIKINPAMIAEKGPDISTNNVSHISKFYQNLKRIYYTRVKHEREVEQKSSVGVLGMFRQAKGRVSKANVMINEYNDIIEKILNLFTWKNVWVSYSFILLLCQVLVMNMFISAKTIITLFILLQFKSGYTSGCWDRLLVSHAVSHIFKATKKLSINTPFWIVQRDKLEKLAAILKRSCGANLSISTIRRAHDVNTLAIFIARIVSKTKMQKSASRNNWFSNLILHSPTWDTL